MNALLDFLLSYRNQNRFILAVVQCEDVKSPSVDFSRTINQFRKLFTKLSFKSLFLPDKNILFCEQTVYAEVLQGNKGKNQLKSYNISDVVAAVDAMDEEDRMIAKMYVCGFSENEIAKRLNLPAKVVKKDIKRVMKFLCRILNK